MPTVCARNSRNSIYLGYFRSAAILKSYYDNSGHQNWCKSILSFIAVMMTHIRCYIYIKLIQYGLTILKEYPQRNKKNIFCLFWDFTHIFAFFSWNRNCAILRLLCFFQLCSCFMFICRQNRRNPPWRPMALLPWQGWLLFRHIVGKMHGITVELSKVPKSVVAA